jgi:translation initiation factor IF-3
MSKFDKVKINEAIRSIEVRVISDDLGNLGVMNTRDAIKKAKELGLDLIEISPDAIPPVAKIMDYGKFQYAQSKKQKEIKVKTKAASAAGEVKNVQIKVGTGEGDIAIKAKKVDEWLTDGSRVKVELFLKGRSKYMDKKFLQERLERILKFVTVPHRVVDGFKDSPKGITVTLENRNNTPLRGVS